MTAARPAWRHRTLLLGRVAVAAALVALAFVLGGPAPAFAHAELVETDPAEGAVVDTAPESVTLTYNETVRLTSQEVVVYDDEGTPVESTATARGTEVTVTLADPAAMHDGTYVVAWNVLSADGHPIGGALTFSVGAPSASVAAPPAPEDSSAAVTVLRDVLVVLSTVALLLAAGLALFTVHVLPRSWAGSDRRRLLRRLVRRTSLVAIVATALLVPVASLYSQGLELGSVLAGIEGSLVQNEIAAATLVLAGLGLVAESLPDEAPSAQRAWLVTNGALLALVGPSLVGHSRAYAPSVLLVVADVLHVVAGAVWLGGLVGLVLTLRALAGREVVAAQALARFSTLAGGLVLAVAATGSFLAWRIVGSWSGLVGTAYGWLLLVKIALALVVAGLGGWNRWRTLPAVRTAVGFSDRERAAALVTRTVRVEAVLLVVLLGVTGVLVNQSPRPAPVSVASGSTGVGAATLGDDLRVLAVLDPRRTGSNTVFVQLQDAAGEPVDPPSPPEVSFSTDGLDAGTLALEAVGSGTYRGTIVLPRPGEWRVQVSVRLSRFEAPVATLTLDVPR